MSVTTSTHLSPRAQALIQQVFELCAPLDFLEDIRTTLHQAGIPAAVATHDTPVLVDWLLQAFSYQGVSDTIAHAYMQAHGHASWSEVEASLAAEPRCPKLKSVAAVQGCGYAKTALTCAEPEHLPACPLPLLPLRNGRLNQIAYGLVLFVRETCWGDLVGWIDQQLAGADDPSRPGRVQRMRAALIEPLSAVPGVSAKVLAMTLSDILLGGDPERERWRTTGASMIAIDTLVHNWLHRTGILAEHEVEHAYGQRCYGPGGCVDLIEDAAQAIDARVLNASFPAVFPRLVQVAIWRLCAERGFSICNGRSIDDRAPCQNETCPCRSECHHIPLKPAAAISTSPSTANAEA